MIQLPFRTPNRIEAQVVNVTTLLIYVHSSRERHVPTDVNAPLPLCTYVRLDMYCMSCDVYLCIVLAHVSLLACKKEIYNDNSVGD